MTLIQDLGYTEEPDRCWSLVQLRPVECSWVHPASIRSQLQPWMWRYPFGLRLKFLEIEQKLDSDYGAGSGVNPC
jgi:hypothetical protein